MTPAEKAGLVIGKAYIYSSDTDNAFPQGSVITFKDDDGTTCVAFNGPSNDGSGWNYAFIDDVKEIAPVGITFTNEETKTEVTVIRFSRKLTTAEEAAITKIFTEGV